MTDLQSLARRLAPLIAPWLPRRLPAAARIANSANLALANTAITTLTFDTTRYFTEAIGSSDRFTAPRDGVYRIGGHARFAASATGQRVLYLRVNGGTYIAIDSRTSVGAGAPTDVHIATEYELAAGDYVQLQAYQDSGGSLTITAAGNYSPEFWLSEVV